LLGNIELGVDMVTGEPIMKARWLKRRKSFPIACARWWTPWSTLSKACSPRPPRPFRCASGSPVFRWSAAA